MDEVPLPTRFRILVPGGGYIQARSGMSRHQAVAKVKRVVADGSKARVPVQFQAMTSPGDRLLKENTSVA